MLAVLAFNIIGDGLWDGPDLRAGGPVEMPVQIVVSRLVFWAFLRQPIGLPKSERRPRNP
ncbi:MAG: hypothetical protein ACRDGM_17560 [bacterium]